MLVFFPLLLTIAIVLIPIVADYNDHSLAARAVGQTWRWFSGHILAALAFSYGTWAIAVLDEHLRSSGLRLPRLAIAASVVGAGLYAAGLGADGVGPVALLTAAKDPSIFFDGSGLWVTSIFVAGTTLYGLGLIAMVVALNKNRFLGRSSGWVSFAGALLFACAPAVLSGWALFGVAGAAFMVFGPIAATVYRQG
jgi:hypothetical protein